MPSVPRALRGLVPDWVDWTDDDTLLAGLFDDVYAEACAISHGNTVGGARIRTGDIRMITAVEVPVSVRPRNHTVSATFSHTALASDHADTFSMAVSSRGTMCILTS